MDININILFDKKSQWAVLALLIAGGFLYSAESFSALQGDSKWLVEKGDSVYSIARKVFPDDVDKQRQFRKKLVEENAALFNGDANQMSVGQTLILPVFAVTKAITPVVVPVAVEPVVSAPVTEEMVIEETVIEEKVEVEQVVTPDPEEVIGRVVISVGEMRADNRGSFRKLLRHSKILKGDTISTSARAYTQIRMKDGALISLRPNTRLKITDYSYSGSEDGSERSYMELLSGGFRTITGYIGHLNKQNYRVKTAVATIGIRGTHYGLMICADGSCDAEAGSLDDGVYGGVVDGSIVIENESGISTFNNDQYFHVASSHDAPVEQLVPPPVFHGKAEAKVVRDGQQKTADVQDKSKRVRDKIDVADRASRKLRGGASLGSLVQSYVVDRLPTVVLADQTGTDVIKDIPVINTAPLGAGVLIALNTIDTIDGIVVTTAAGVPAGVGGNQVVLGTRIEDNGIVIKNLPVGIRESATGQVNQLILPSGVKGISDIGGVGGDGFGVNWGRWSDNYVLTENGVVLPSVSDVHYIYSDRLTTPNELTQLSALGGLTMETYTLFDGTTPTNVAGLPATLNTITAQVDFVNGVMTDYQISAQDQGTFFDMQATNVSFSNMNEFDLSPVSPGLCNAGCIGRASAAFVGNIAQGMMTSYSIKEATPGSVKGANGTAILLRDSVVGTAIPPQ